MTASPPSDGSSPEPEDRPAENVSAPAKGAPARTPAAPRAPRAKAPARPAAKTGSGAKAAAAKTGAPTSAAAKAAGGSGAAKTTAARSSAAKTSAAKATPATATPAKTVTAKKSPARTAGTAAARAPGESAEGDGTVVPTVSVPEPAASSDEQSPAVSSAEAAPVAGAKDAPEPAPAAEPEAATDGDAPPAPAEPSDDGQADAVVPAVRLHEIAKSYGAAVALAAISLDIPVGTFYGIVGPNGAGKTTLLSIIAGLIRPDTGTVRIAGVDLATHERTAKARLGILPDRLRTFDRLTGRQLLHYYGVLRGLRPSVVEERTADLARAFDLTSALGRPVSDYSAGMTKKLMLAGAMIHSPRVLVLDEPFEAVDPVSAAVIVDILEDYVGHGGTVVISSHGMELIERVCSRVAVIADGVLLAEGSMAEVRGDVSLQERLAELSASAGEVGGLEWLHTFSD